MAVLYIYESVNAAIDTYDRVAAELEDEGMPEGAIAHVACKRDGSGLVVVEVWESEEVHDQFDEILNERIKLAGGAARPEPRKLPVYNMIFAEETAGLY